MEQMKVGIIGAGRIAANMAKTLDGMDDAAAYAIAARNLDRAQNVNTCPSSVNSNV